MESNKFIEKLAWWALMLMEYDFKVVYHASLVNMDANSLSCNPSLSQVDSSGAQWHVEDGEDLLPSWHFVAYLNVMAMD